MINKAKLMVASAALATAPLAACADNYAAEGAAVGALGGAAVAAVTGGDVSTGAAVGAAAGAAAGYFVDKDNDCDGWRGNQWDDDCRGTYGYPD